MHEVEFLTVGSPFPHHPGQQGNVFRKIPDSLDSFFRGESFSEQVMVQDSSESFLHFQGQRGNQRP